MSNVAHETRNAGNDRTRLRNCLGAEHTGPAKFTSKGPHERVCLECRVKRDWCIAETETGLSLEQD